MFSSCRLGFANSLTISTTIIRDIKSVHSWFSFLSIFDRVRRAVTYFGKILGRRKKRFLPPNIS